MPNLKYMTSAAVLAAFAFSGSALAQDADTDWAATPEPSYDHFAIADANVDEGLDRTEFEVYVNSRADAGDTDYAAIRDNGDYDTQFMIKDVNADGLITADEVAPTDEMPVDETEEEAPPVTYDDQDTIEE